MRVLIFVAFAAALAAPPASAQAVDPDFVHGRDYTFERLEATRTVHDTEDSGTIRLVSYVYRPVKKDRHEVVLYSHGSTGGLIRSPKEPGDAPPPSVMHFFVSRGYTLVAPMRRGRGESTGTYVEECAFYLGECTLSQQTATLDRSLREASLDTEAVIEQVVGRLVTEGSKIILAGNSRGGFLSLMMAGQHPQLVKGVVNFVGGWLSINEKYPLADQKTRLQVQIERLTDAAKHDTAPTIWIYADRDPFFTEDARRAFLGAWRDGGGQAEDVFVAQHALRIGHLVATEASLWEPQLGAFLKRIEPPAQ